MFGFVIGGGLKFLEICVKTLLKLFSLQDHVKPNICKLPLKKIGNPLDTSKKFVLLIQFLIKRNFNKIKLNSIW